MVRGLLSLSLLVGCGPSTVQDAEQAKDVSWLAEKGHAGDGEALLALCGLARSGTDGAAAALAQARAGVDPARSIESISCFVDLALAGDAAFVDATRQLLKAPAVPVRVAAVNALAASGAARKPAAVAFVPDLQQRLRDEEQAVWKRAILALNAIGPAGRKALTLALELPERTRRRELLRDVVDLETIDHELGRPALAWLAEGESEVFDHLLRVVVRSGTTIEEAKPTILALLGSTEEDKVDGGSHLARALAEEVRCDAEVTRAVVAATSRTACEEPCLVQARSVAYRCRRVADRVLRQLAEAPADGPAARPREIARATLGLE